MTDEEEEFSKRGKSEGKEEAQMSGRVESEFMNPGEVRLDHSFTCLAKGFRHR